MNEHTEILAIKKSPILKSRIFYSNGLAKKGQTTPAAKLEPLLKIRNYS